MFCGFIVYCFREKKIALSIHDLHFLIIFLWLETKILKLLQSQKSQKEWRTLLCSINKTFSGNKDHLST